MEGGDSLSTDTHGFDFRAIFHDECTNDKKYFDKEDDIRRRIYLLLSNSTNLSLKCVKLIKEFISYVDKIILTMERDPLDLMGILISKSEIITEEYKCTNLTPVLFTKRRPTLFTELVLEANCSKKTNIKSKVTAIAYEEIENKSIGKQHIMYTTQPGSISDTSSSADDDDDDSSSNPSLPLKRKRKTCQKAGDFDLGGHENNCHFNNSVKCQVEILILVGNICYCETLAEHLGLIWFEGLLEGEEDIERRLQDYENKIYRLAHTEIIKKMMNGYSSICITTSTSAWEYIPACTKGIIYTRDEEPKLYDLHQMSASYCVFVEDNILAYVDAISKIVQKSLLCDILVEVNYQADEKAYTKIQLPITVLIPFYIVKYFSQSFIVTHGTWSNSKILDIFESKAPFIDS